MTRLRHYTIVLAATAFCALSAGAVRADHPADRGGTPGLGWGSGGSKGAPGPIAGAGLPFILIAGAYGVYRRVRRQRSETGRPEQHRQN